MSECARECWKQPHPIRFHGFLTRGMRHHTRLARTLSFVHHTTQHNTTQHNTQRSNAGTRFNPQAHNRPLFFPFLSFPFALPPPHATAYFSLFFWARVGSPPFPSLPFPRALLLFPPPFLRAATTSSSFTSLFFFLLLLFSRFQPPNIVPPGSAPVPGFGGGEKKGGRRGRVWKRRGRGRGTGEKYKDDGETGRGEAKERERGGERGGREPTSLISASVFHSFARSFLPSLLASNACPLSPPQKSPLRAQYTGLPLIPAPVCSQTRQGKKERGGFLHTQGARGAKGQTADGKKRGEKDERAGRNRRVFGSTPRSSLSRSRSRTTQPHPTPPRPPTHRCCCCCLSSSSFIAVTTIIIITTTTTTTTTAENLIFLLSLPHPSPPTEDGGGGRDEEC